MSITSPRPKRRKLDCVEPRSDIGFTFIHKQLIKHQTSLKRHRQRYEACWSDAKRMVQAEYKKRLEELENFQTSSLQQLTTVKKNCDLRLQERSKHLQHDAELAQSLQKLKWKGGLCKVFDILDPMDPVIKRALASPTLSILPNVVFTTGQLECKLSLSEMCVGGLDDVINKVPHRCFSSDIVGLVLSYCDTTPMDFKGEHCVESNGHNKKEVNCVVELGGGRFATGDDNNSIYIWDSQSGKQLLELEGHTNTVSSLVVIGNTRLLSGSWDRTLRLWDLRTGQLIRVFRGHTSDIRSVCLCDDSNGVVSVVSGGEDDTIRTWDLDTGICIRVMREHTNWVMCISAFTDGQRLVSGSWDHTLRVWNVKTGKCLMVLKGHIKSVESVIVLADQKRAVSASDDSTLRVWDIETGECLRILKGHTSSVQSVSAFADGQRVISGSYDGSMRVWNVDTGECLKVVKLKSKVYCVCCLEDDRVVSVDSAGNMQLWK